MASSAVRQHPVGLLPPLRCGFDLAVAHRPRAGAPADEQSAGVSGVVAGQPGRG